MPELPEVETIARALREGGREGEPILGLRLSGVQVNWARSIQEPAPDLFMRRILDQVVEKIDRRGKYLIISLSRDELLIHLRMSGDLRVESDYLETGEKRPVGNHDRILFSFENGLRLTFEDTRKFGRLWLVPDAEKVVGVLGPEPFDPSFSPALFFERLSDRKRLLKPLLMDQSFLAGMGNIYTDEALHLAGLHPKMISNQLNETQTLKLFHAIRKVLLEGIEQNGASIDWVYRGGSFQNLFRVYGRSGEPCRTCGHSIERIVVGQRGTHFCPVCQPSPHLLVHEKPVI